MLNSSESRRAERPKFVHPNNPGWREYLTGVRRAFLEIAVVLVISLSMPIFVSAASPDFAISSNISSQTVPPGGTASFKITLASANGFSGPVNLIPSVSSQPEGVAVNVKMNRIYAVDWQSSSLIVINGADDSIIARIPVMQRPNAVAVDPSKNKTYVTSWNSRGISVIDDTTNQLLYTIDNFPAFAIAINAVTGIIYTANDTAVTAIDSASATIIGRVAVGYVLTGIAVNAVTNRVYVGSEGTNDIYVIDGSTLKILAAIQVSNYPGSHYVDVNPKTNKIYATDNNYLDSLNGASVFVIDGSTNTISASMTVYGTLNNILVNPDLNEVYVADQFSYYGGPPPNDRIVVINATTNIQITNIFVGAVPSGIGLNKSTGSVYVDNENSDTMSIIDAPSLTVRATVILDPTISASPPEVTLSPGGTAVSTVNITTYQDTRFGTYNFYVYGNSSSGVHSITISVTVGDFTVSDGDGFWTIPRGATISDVIDVKSLAGSWTINMTATVALNLTGSPGPPPISGSPDLTVNFTPANFTITPTSPMRTTVAVGVPRQDPIANYTLTIIGTSGTLSHSMKLVVRVVDFTVTAAPGSLTIPYSGSGRTTILVSGQNGFSGYAQAHLTATPSSLLCSLNTTQLVLIVGSANPSVATTGALLTCQGPPGDYSVVVTVTSYIQVHNVTIPVSIGEPSGIGGGGGGPTGGGTAAPSSPTVAQQVLLISLLSLLVAAPVVATILYLDGRRRRRAGTERI